uniref:Beclin 1-associated autophagy-related key regulator n=1 Tax=Phallusia mammillata TaxID=59560 RepID=A0A6F9D6I6_9ASCI|nr:beclin 1-associated autophagy-related key regulator [Phallusia mammillata]
MEGDSNDQAPNKDFQDVKISFVYDRCPVCDKVGKSLACSKCLEKDESKSFLILCEGKVRKSQSRLARPMFLLRSVQENLQQTQFIVKSHVKEKLSFVFDRLEEDIASITEKAQLISSINQCKANVERLKKLLVARKLESEHQQHVLMESKKSLSVYQKRHSRIQGKKSKMKEYIENKQMNITLTLSKIEPLTITLNRKRVEYISMLVEYIFPIKELKRVETITSVDGKDEDESDFVSDKDRTLLQEELEEARRMSFVHGRWVDQQAGISDIVQISVGADEASAPSDGNYAPYLTWLENNYKQTASDPPNSPGSLISSTSESFIVQHRAQNSAMAVSAALSHAAQMVHVMRKLLHVHLPHRLHFKTFCSPTISPLVFSNTVKLLNSNILTLCLNQGVDGFTLHPLHTLRNLQVLTVKLQKDGLRPFPCTPAHDLILYLEETLVLTDISDDELDNDNDVTLDWQLSLDEDWETVPTSESKSQGTAPMLPYTSINTQSSMAQPPSGLVTSALGWVKGWWGPNE